MGLFVEVETRFGVQCPECGEGLNHWQTKDVLDLDSYWYDLEQGRPDPIELNDFMLNHAYRPQDMVSFITSCENGHKRVFIHARPFYLGSGSGWSLREELRR